MKLLKEAVVMSVFVFWAPLAIAAVMIAPYELWRLGR
jgi:hypothetical protein